MTQLFDENSEKYYQPANAREKYLLLNWTNTLWEIVRDALIGSEELSEFGKSLPEEMDVSGPRYDARGKEKFWYFVANGRSALEIEEPSGAVAFVTPRSYIRNHDYVVVDYLGRVQRFNLAESSFKNDKKFYESLEAEFSPMAIARGLILKKAGVNVEQDIEFYIPIIGEDPVVTYADLFNEKEWLLTTIQERFSALIPPGNFLEERYLVGLKQVKMFIDPPEVGQTFLGDYRGIQLSELPAKFVVRYELQYVDEHLLRPSGAGAKASKRKYEQHKREQQLLGFQPK